VRIIRINCHFVPGHVGAPQRRRETETRFEQLHGRDADGAMIILVRRKNRVVASEKPAATLSAYKPTPSSCRRSSPNRGPASMAKMTNHVRRDFIVSF
jgi:hypothetical protein